MTYEEFCCWWNYADGKTKISAFKDYCAEEGCDDEFYDFDDDFFQMFADDPMEICRATVYGDVNFMDEYIRKDVYGNFETLTYYDAVEVCDEHMEEIFESGCFESYIKIQLKYDNNE